MGNYRGHTFSLSIHNIKCHARWSLTHIFSFLFRKGWTTWMRSPFAKKKWKKKECYPHLYSAELQHQKLCSSDAEICCLISPHSVDQTMDASRRLWLALCFGRTRSTAQLAFCRGEGSHFAWSGCFISVSYLFFFFWFPHYSLRSMRKTLRENLTDTFNCKYENAGVLLFLIDHIIGWVSIFFFCRLYRIGKEWWKRQNWK